jgi:mannosyltransferase
MDGTVNNRNGPALSRIFWLAAAVLTAGLLRFFRLGHQSLWADEVGTWVNVLNHNSSIAHFAFHANNAPPLYFWALYPVLQILGSGEFALRILSAVCGVLSVPVLWMVARRFFPKGAAAELAAFLLALNPLHIWFSQEARPYAFFVLLFLATCLQFLHAMDKPDRLWRWFWLTVFLVLCALTHTLAIILGGLFFCWFFFAGPNRKSLTGLAVSGAVFCAVVLPVVFYISRIGGVAPAPRPFSGFEIPYTFFSFLAGYSYGPPVRDIQMHGLSSALSAYAPQVLTVLCALGLLGLTACRKFSREQLPVFIWILIPVLMAAAIAWLTPHSYNVRFTLPALPGFLLLIADLLTKLSRYGRVALGTLIAGLFLWADMQWFFVPAYGKEDSRSAVRTVLRECSNLKAVAIAPAYMADTVRYYLSRFEHVAEVCPVSGPFPPEAEALMLTRCQHIPFIDGLKAKITESGDRVLSETGYEIFVRTPSLRIQTGE